MRLINVHTLELTEFSDIDQAGIKYAILSHRWEDDEVLYQDMLDKADRFKVRLKHGYAKIQMCCRKAAQDDLKYVWVDTCCIDKSSSAELQEAINSMYRWYNNATICYAYLTDVDGGTIEDSLWFTRGWTLQELLAPRTMLFFDSTWSPLGSRRDLIDEISKVTRISRNFLESGLPKEDRPCVAEIMSWAKGRRTTRVEDRAYSLLGLFDVSMPLLYGEGERAFQRLQEEILRQNDDQSIFAWSGVENGRPSLLAQSPDQFAHLSEVMQLSNNRERRKPHNITNEGISLEFEMAAFSPDVYCACLNVEGTSTSSTEGSVSKIAILVKRIDDDGRYARLPGSYVKESLQDLSSSGKTLAELISPLHDLVQVKQTLLSSFEKRQITVVRELKGSEITRYDLRIPIAITICLDSSSDDHWARLVKHSYIKIHGCDYDPTIRTLSGRPGNYGSMGMIQIVGRLEPFLTFPLEWIALGFDLDFKPVVILKAGEWNPQCYRLMRSSGPFKIPMSTSVPAWCKPNEIFSLDEIQNGSGGVFADDVVAIKKNATSWNDSASADLLARVQILMYDGVALMTLSMGRPAPTEPWTLSLRIEDFRHVAHLSRMLDTIGEADNVGSSVPNIEAWDIPVNSVNGKLVLGKRKHVVFEDDDERRDSPKIDKVKEVVVKHEPQNPEDSTPTQPNKPSSSALAPAPTTSAQTLLTPTPGDDDDENKTEHADEHENEHKEQSEHANEFEPASPIYSPNEYYYRSPSPRYRSTSPRRYRPRSPPPYRSPRYRGYYPTSPPRYPYSSRY